MTDNGLEILIVEDSPTQAEELKYTLELHGYDISVAKNSIEALEALRKRKPGLVISDIVMPEMDGFTLCRMIKADEHLRDVPVILLTSLSEPQDVLKGLACGADNFITKPYGEHHLLARIDNVLLNTRLRRDSKMKPGDEIVFMGETYHITSGRAQILDFLLSTYETTVIKNRELKDMQDKLEAMNEELNRALKISEERTAALEAANRELEGFTYSVSHDLRAPVRHITAFSELLKDVSWTNLDEEGRQFLTTIMRSSRKLGTLIDDLLEFSRMGRSSMHKNVVDLQQLIPEVIQSFDEETRSRNVEWKVASLPKVSGDDSMLRLVFSNLFANAVKFTRTRAHAAIEIGCTENESEYVIHVKDNGVGFDMKYYEKLFRVFHRLHSDHEFEGTGVGLANVQRIIHRHGGRVWAEGKVDSGATFFISLPKRQKE